MLQKLFKEKPNIIQNLKNKVIVSVQAAPNEPFYDETAMCAMMKSVVAGGAAGLRLAGARDVKNAKKMFPEIPVIGITKPDKMPENYLDVVYITPTINQADTVIEAGADIIAFDATQRPRSDSVFEMIDFIHLNGKLAMADISTYDEAKGAIESGADIVSTTLSGYTTETKDYPPTPDFTLCRMISEDYNTPVILEGKIWTPDDVREAFNSGAHCVVIGSAITRPHLITKRFTEIL